MPTGEPAESSSFNTEELILEAVKSGDPVLIERLLRIYSPLLLTWAHPLLGQQALSQFQPEDVVQEACIGAFRGFKGFTPTADARKSFEAWLSNILKNSAALVGRKAKRAITQGLGRLEGDLLENKGVQVPTPSRGARRRESLKLLAAAIEELSPIDAEVIRAYYATGRSIEEVAGSLGITPGALHGRLQRARWKLEEILGSSSKFFSSK